MNHGNPQGEFVWYELLTPDMQAAKDFYGPLLGWRFVDSGNNHYHLIENTNPGEPHACGGALPLSAEMQAGGAHPGWLGYIGVENVDASLERLCAAGASVLMPAWDIPDVGRLALLSDPQGIPFYIMRGASTETSHAFAFDRPRVGHCAWNELVTPDPDAAWAFYGAEFHWQKDGEMDMGPDMGTYQFIRHTFIRQTKAHEGGMIGAMMPLPDGVPQGQWNFYFRVADIDAAIKQLTATGGQVINGPDEIPGGDFSLLALDPQGGYFALVGARKK